MNVGRRSWWPVVVMVALAACLLGLAFLQYRWIGQLSQAEQQRMQTSLRTATFGFSRDFDSSISHVYAALQMRRGSESHPLEDEYAERWMDWMATSADRSMVRGFYLVQMPPGTDRLAPRTTQPDAKIFSNQRTRPALNALKLSYLNRQMGAFETIGWPARFAALKARMEAALQPDRPRGPAFASAVDPEIPAVVARLFHFAAPPPDTGAQPEPGRFFRRPSIDGWAIAELDLDWIQKQLLPELVERHFAGAGGLDYQVGIIEAAAPHRLIFSSDPKLTLAYFSSADATAGLFDV
ncbi:MAG: hypothetical protein ACREMY_05550, partial [bacterium]